MLIAGVAGLDISRARTELLEGDSLEQVLGIEALPVSLAVGLAVGHEGALGAVQHTGGLDVVGGGFLCGVSGGAAEAGAEGAETFEVDNVGVEQVFADGNGELDEHGQDVGVGHGGGVGDLVGQVFGGDAAAGHSLEEPLLVDLALGNLVLNFSVKYWHNRVEVTIQQGGA